MWMFPEMGVPPNHPFLAGIFPLNHPAMGVTPMTMETTMWGNDMGILMFDIVLLQLKSVVARKYFMASMGLLLAFPSWYLQLSWTAWWFGT